MQTKAVLFDLYGTLLVYGNMDRAFGLWYDSIAGALRTFGRELSGGEVKKLFKNFFTTPAEYSDELTLYERRIEIILNGIGIRVSKEWLHDFSDHSMDGWQKEIWLHPEAPDLLDELKERGFKTGVVSNFDHYPHVRKLLRTTGLAPKLDTVILSGEVKLKKPDERIFRLAAESLRLEPGEVLFVGDDAEEDAGAKSAGMRWLCYKNGTPLKPILQELE